MSMALVDAAWEQMHVMGLLASCVGMQIRPLALWAPVLVLMPAATPTLVLSSNPVPRVMTLVRMLVKMDTSDQ